MKKLIAILFAVALIAMLPMTAFAATGLNEYEQEIMSLLNSSTYEIPQKYINTALNYFAGDCDLTKEEMESIKAYINQGYAVIETEIAEQEAAGEEVSASSISSDARNEVISLGKSACEEIDLQLSYNAKNNAITITQTGSATPVMESSSAVKSTGEFVTVDAAFVGTAVLLCLVLCTGAMFVVSKKNGLFV